ncbi:MAG: dUTP diphosphatase [Clostridia bacterium]|nr:dUTP diphosphatase [Clostridia bacterium]
MNVKVKLIPTENGKYADMPKYQSEFSAGADLCACIDAPVTIAPGERALIPTGIAIDMERRDCGAFIFARSGLASKHGICLANGVGVVDSDYRGEIKVALVNTSKQEYSVAPFERIAQLVIMPVISASFLQADELSDTDRGSGGFGSTGK